MANWRFLYHLLSLLHLFSRVSIAWSDSESFKHAEDLQVFVSRPDLRPPKFKITPRSLSNATTPGYLFVAPYCDLKSRASSSLYTPSQTGPHIFDGEGNLVWSGAHLFGDRPTFDFKMSVCHGKPCFTFILHEDLARPLFPGGAGIVMDTSYKIRDIIESGAGRGTMNMHEFTAQEDGTAVYVTFTSQMAPIGDARGFIGNNGFREVDIKTGNTTFEWWALDHVDPLESHTHHPATPGKFSAPWDFFHLNSIHKNADGDYLISSRYFDAVYKISGRDGSILWQLGGKSSSFAMVDNFTFSSQHHARFVNSSDSTTVISLLNNAADDHATTDRLSSAMYISLDTNSMTARLLTRYNRPDQLLTRLRGSVQELPNGNNFVSWSENAYVSEFDSQGNCLFEAQFESHRLVTYRAFKFNFTGQPSEEIALVAHMYNAPTLDSSQFTGITPGGASNASETSLENRSPGASNTSVTALYVSWNGATEVKSWRFFGTIGDSPELCQLGQVTKAGFETALTVVGADNVFVEALDSQGGAIGKSRVVKAVRHGLQGVASSPTGSSSPATLDGGDAGSEDREYVLSTSAPANPFENWLTAILVVACIAQASALVWAVWKIKQLAAAYAQISTDEPDEQNDHGREHYADKPPP